MDVGIVWPTPFKDNIHQSVLDGGILEGLKATKATHLRLNLDHRNPHCVSLVEQANQAGFQVLPILECDYQNPDLEGYADFCESIVEQFKFPIVEILNEPRIMEKMSAAAYRKVFIIAAERLQRFRPTTQIASAADFLQPDVAGTKIRWEWNWSTFKRDKHWYKDANVPPELYDLAAVHPYREPGMPDVSQWKNRQAEYQAYKDECHQKPLIITEVGWNLASVTEEVQAQHLYRELVINYECGVQGVYIYSMISEMHDGMGVLREDGSARPAVGAIAQFQEEYHGST